MNPSQELDAQRLQELEQKFDPEMRFRPVLPPAVAIVRGLLIALSLFHFYTAGFGLLRETTHRGVHLAFVLGLIFLVFAATARGQLQPGRSAWLSPGGVPLLDWLLAGTVALSVLYIPWIFEDLAFRVGNPGFWDVLFGSVLFVALLEATRRSMGWPLPLIALAFTLYALAGPYFPGLLKHAGATWSQMINHQYLTSQGIYGVAVGVVATYVFHFVLFGVFMQVHFVAKRDGLRGLSDDEMPRLKESLRQRWPTLIPLVLLISILVSGRTPYLAAFTGIASCVIVGLTTQAQANRPRHWMSLLLLHILLGLITFVDWGQHSEPIKLILFTVGVLLWWALHRWAQVRGRIEAAVLVEAFETGAKYALAVGAAAATVGIVIGVVTLTGVGFKISFIITQWSQAAAGWAAMVLPAGWTSMQTLTLLAALIMTGVVCILMGCGIPTTANYIIMVTVAAPTLVQLGVEPLVAHFFVFYYGVLADITPPVALAAYAAAGMAGGDPFRTGNQAFKLGLAKALVPFVFVFSPSLLLVAKGFNWPDFFVTFTGCIVGITVLAATLSRYMLTRMQPWEQALGYLAALCLVAPGLWVSVLGLVLITPVVIRQWRDRDT